MKLTTSLAITLLILAACSSEQAGSTLVPAGSQSPSGQTVQAGPVSIHTTALDLNAEAGSTVDVKCFYLDSEGVRLTGPALSVVISDASVEHKILGDQVTLYPETAGDLRVQCKSADGVFIDPVGVSFNVSPGLPFAMQVDAVDDDCLLQNVTLPIHVVVFDAFGNTVLNPRLDVQFIPDTGVSGALDSGFRFATEGEFDITVSLAGPTAVGADLTPFTHTLHVDESPPELLILSPARGETLELGSLDDAEVSIWVSAADGVSPIHGLEINELTQDIEQGALQISAESSQTSRWGMSVVRARSEDSCGNVAYVAHAYYRSPSYLVAAQEVDDAAILSNALVTRFQQSFVDDGDRATLNDLASIAQAAASQIDLNENIPVGTVLAEDPYLEDCGGNNSDTSFEISRNEDPWAQLNIDGPSIHDLRVVDGGIEFDLSVENIQVPLSVWATASTCVLFDITWADVETTVDVFVEQVYVSGFFALSYANSEPAVSLDDFVADFSGTHIDVDCGIVDFACDGISNAAKNVIESKIESILQEKIRGDVAPMLQEALAAFAPQPTLSLPQPMGVELTLAAGLSAIEFCGVDTGCGDETMQGAGLVAFDAQIVPQERGEYIAADTRGAISRGANQPEFSADAGFGVAIRDDFINQLFWSVWYSGAMDINAAEVLADSLPPAIESAQVTMLSPPVVMPGGGEHGLMMGVGNVLIATRFDAGAMVADASGIPAEEAPYIPMEIEATVSALVDGSIGLAADGSKIELVFEEQPQIFVEVSRVDNSPLASELGAMVSEMLPHLLPVLLTEVVTAIELPAIDVGALLGDPNAAPIGLTNGRIAHTSDYILLEGDLGLR